MNRWIAGTALLLCAAAASWGVVSADTRTVSLEWTAPGDDGYVGKAYIYDIRYSRTPFTAATFLLGTRLNVAIVPGVPGIKEHVTVVGLIPGVGYYFAVRAMDDGGNWSPVSNIAFLPANTVGVDAQYGEPEFSAAFPNPALGRTRFSVTLPRPQWLRVEAFDIAGRKVRTLAMGQYSAGNFDLHWDLRDDAGQHLEPGAYLVRSQVGDAVFLRRVLVVD